MVAAAFLTRSPLGQTALTSLARSSRQRRAILVAAHRAGKPSSSSSLADGKRVGPFPLHCSLRSLRLPLVGQPRSARRCAMRHDEDAPEGEHGSIRPARIGLIEQLLILSNELRPLIIGERLQHRSRRST
jgi:hypothetical protein